MSRQERHRSEKEEMSSELIEGRATVWQGETGKHRDSLRIFKFHLSSVQVVAPALTVWSRSNLIFSFSKEI